MFTVSSIYIVSCLYLLYIITSIQVFHLYEFHLCIYFLINMVYFKNSLWWKKIPLIPLILLNKKLISNFKDKANHFNAFFTSQCTPVSNDSALPSTNNSVSNVSLLSIQFKDKDILKVIRSLNYNRAHGYDDISIRLLEICDSSIVKPLSIIFKNCLYTNWDFS